MAIKISGTTVIDDSGNFTNIANTTATTLIGDGSQLTGVSKASAVVPPLNESPADGATGVLLTPTLEASRFISLFDRTHANTQFQVSIDSGFSNTEVDVFTGANTTLVTSTLAEGIEHFFRVRYFDNEGCCSPFSDSTSFTTISYPDTFGESIFGGFYAGTICAASTCYYLIMAPNATGCVGGCQYKTAVTSSGVGETGEALCDGYGNTYDHLADATHPAGNWTATRSIAGFSDWYLPAVNEMIQLYNNKASAPAGEGFRTSFPNSLYWTSTECASGGYSTAKSIRMTNRSVNQASKTSSYVVRAVRRVAFP